MPPYLEETVSLLRKKGGKERTNIDPQEKRRGHPKISPIQGGGKGGKGRKNICVP